MKKIFRSFLIDTASLYATSLIASGMVFQRGWMTILMTGAAVTVASFVAKPIISILLLPLNLVTFGVFKWVSAGVILFLVTLVIKDFSISEFIFLGLSTDWIDIPSLHFSGALAYISFSLIFSLLSSTIHWISK